MLAVWLRRFWVASAAYMFLRILFLLFSWNSLKDIYWAEFVSAFIQGLRFDLAAIVTLNAPLILMHVALLWIQDSSLVSSPSASRRWGMFADRFIFVLFCIVNIPFLVIGTADTLLFTFTGRRTTPDFFGIAGDIRQQGISIILQYWWLSLLGVIVCMVFISASWIITPRAKLRVGGTKGWFVFLCFVAGSVLLARGGFQRKPLVPAHAYVFQPPVLANLVLNSTITMLRSPPSAAPVRFYDFSDMQSVRRILTPDPSLEGMPERVALAPGRNVVVIIVESLGSEYVGALNHGKGYTPFLDSLMEKSVTFQDSFANGRRSIDAMPSIFASIPAWRDQPYVTSPYSGNEIQALPHLLKVQGYETYFFHGAANGSMHFDVFSAMAGFDHYLGRTEYSNEEDFDGSWGIFDEPFLKFAAETLDQSKKPFFAGIFTLSSHNPFPIPKAYQGKFPKGTLPIHESIGYSDYALQQFFETVKTKGWYSNTLFVITGDHTSLTDQPGYDTPLGRYRVPVIFFDPAGSLPMVGRAKIAQHVDIAPTLLDLLGLKPKNPTLFGWSLFSPHYNGRMIQYEYGSWYYYDLEHFIRMDDQSNAVSLFAPSDHALQTPLASEVAGDELIQKKLRTLKAARQYFSNGLLENSWQD